ncbi:MAG: GNAT family N-acetyltransferase [Acidimicrobiales bacterium]|jgi:acyl-CoA synthetase (NDP forming)/RimJ/RimL family protein N-acetyltransferase|nr:GNAT family N-acetyltransferase [Acidimicrobiales bacterium]
MAGDDVPTPLPEHYPARWETDVVLSDGGTVHVRPIRPDDAARLVTFHGRQSAESIYYRFFSPRPRLSDREVERFTTIDYTERMAFIALLGDDIVGVARYDVADPKADGTTQAEVAFFVDDRHHGRGLATLLLEFLAVAALERGIGGFVATVLPDNRGMINVFRRAGFDVSTAFSDGVVEVTLGIVPTAEGQERIEARQQRAEAASVARLLSPATVAVVGAGRRPGSIGHEVLRQLVAADFNGAVYPVNPNATHIHGIRAYPTVSAIPDEVDLAVIAVPLDQIDATVADCAQKRVEALVVVTDGFRASVQDTLRGDGGTGVPTARQRALVSAARRHGMRLIGPASVGIVNQAADVRLRATFAPEVPPPGRVALSTQSGSMGNAILDYATESGLALSCFVNLGDKADVSANDLLQYWRDDTNTDVICLYLEGFGNPRKFFRIARRLGHTKPLVVMRTASLDFGSAAAWPTPDTFSALMAQAGVVETDSLAELFDAARLLAAQPLPQGDRVAVLANSAGTAALGAETARRSGLDAVPYVIDGDPAAFAAAVVSAVFDEQPALPAPGFATPDRPGGAPRGPAAATGPDAAATPEPPCPDAVLIVSAETVRQRGHAVAAAVDEALAALRGARSEAGDVPPGRTVLACYLGQPLPGVPTEPGGIPRYRFPEEASRALARAAAHARWRSEPIGDVQHLDQLADARTDVPVDLAAIADIVGRGLHAAEGDTAVQLPLADAVALLAAAGLTPVVQDEAEGVDAAVALAGRIGYPVALKARCRSRVARSAATGLALGLHDEGELRHTYAVMAEKLGAPLGPVLVQAMAEPGVEVQIVGHQDNRLGTLLALGRGGALGSDPHELAVRMVPLTDIDAERLLAASPVDPLLARIGGDAARRELEAVLGRLSALMEHVPELVEVRLDPVLVSAQGVAVTDVTVQLAPVAVPLEPPVRRLR